MSMPIPHSDSRVVYQDHRMGLRVVADCWEEMKCWEVAGCREGMDRRMMSDYWKKTDRWNKPDQNYC